MKSGRLEFLLIILIVAGLGYVGLQYFSRPKAPPVCGPLALSPEVKAYIDRKLTTPAEPTGDLASLNARVTEFETKFKSIDKDLYLKANAIVEARRLAISAKVREQRKSVAEISERIREVEIGRLRSETAGACAGIAKARSKATNKTPVVPPSTPPLIPPAKTIVPETHVEDLNPAAPDSTPKQESKSDGDSGSK